MAQLKVHTGQHTVDVGSTPWCGNTFFSSQNQLSVRTLTVSVQPLCIITCIYLCVRKKFQALAAIPFSGHTNMLHTLLGMGTAALAAAVGLPR